MGEAPKVLLVDDHSGHAERFLSLLAADSRAATRSAEELQSLERGIVAPKGQFHWLRTPGTAIKFLGEQAADPQGWRPDIVLVDFAFEGTADTGLAVAAAVHQHFPRARLVAFSGQDLRHGRQLFHAALYHWFGARTILNKNGPTKDYADLLKGTDTTEPLMAKRLREHAALIDLFFYQPAIWKILSTWEATRGQAKSVQRILDISRSTASRRIEELAQLGATFNSAFRLPTFDGSENKDRLGSFLSENQSFFNDPHLPGIIDRVAPWSKVSHQDLITTCALAGWPISAR